MVLNDWTNQGVIRPSYYDSLTKSLDPYYDDGTIDDVSGMQMLQVMEKGLLKTLIARRDDAKAVWEEEDDDASYGEYNALKGAVELLEAFIHQAPKARYSGLKKNDNRYDSYGRGY